MDLYSFFEDFVKSDSKILVNLKKNEPIAPKTTFKIGGNAEIFAEPSDIYSLVQILKFVIKEKIKFFVLAGGSNIVFTDGVFSGIVISLSKISSIKIQNQNEKNVFVECLCGVSMANLVNFATENDLWGVQFFAGLPGFISGAVFMNARCFEKEISEIFESAQYFDKTDFKIKTQDFCKTDWEYKKSPFQDKNKIILSVVFRLQKKDSIFHEDLILENKKYINERKSRGHFSFPSAGSVFKNNRDFGFPSGKIIDDCGLKSKQIGKAQIAPFHANFIINLGGAFQKDVKDLVDFTIQEVKKQKGFTLEPEIIFVE